MPFEIIRNDITKLGVGAIVNAANNALQQGGGVCGAIFAAAGAEKLQRACDMIGRCETGQAVITKGYALPAGFVIHTAGPIWRGGGCGEKELLYACYKNSLELAKANNLESIAFPLISSGIYGYPKDQALQVAVSAIGDFLLQNDMHVSLVVFDKAAYSLGEKLHSAIKAYIDDNYAETHYIPRRAAEGAMPPGAADADFGMYEKMAFDAMPLAVESFRAPMKAQAAPMGHKRGLNDVIARLDETFSQRLLRLIDEKQRVDADVYKRANIDRRVFSKIRSNKDYRPSKNTALAFAVALELSLDDTRDLLMAAGFALSRSNKLDVIVEYFLSEKNYNIFEINEALFAFDQNLLGA